MARRVHPPDDGGTVTSERQRPLLGRSPFALDRAARVRSPGDMTREKSAPRGPRSERTVRCVGTALLALIGLALLIGSSGVRFVRQPLGSVGVVRNGGPLDNRHVRQILEPGGRPTFTGLFSQPPHNYPSVRSPHEYTVTSDAERGSRPGVGVVWIPTRDGVRIGLDATVTLRFVGESDPAVLEQFDSTVGTRTFALPSGEQRHPWNDADGFAAMLDGVFRPVLVDDLRREVSGFDCAEIVPACALVRPSKRGAGDGSAIRTIETGVNRSLSDDLASTIGQPYFRGVRFSLIGVTLPESLESVIARGQLEYAEASRARGGG